MIKLSKFEKTILLTLLVLVIIFVGCFVVFYEKYDLFKFPFNSDVWGTASDWFMILVTISTAKYLIMTFREQKRTNDFQHQVQLDNIFPKFSIEQTELGFSTDDNISHNQYYLSLKLIRNDAREFKVENLHENIRVSIFDSPFLKEGSVLSFELSNKITSGMDDQIKQLFTFQFQDVNGNKYTHKALIRNNTIYLDKQTKLTSIKSCFTA